jgi:hypothetical protein
MRKLSCETIGEKLFEKSFLSLFKNFSVREEKFFWEEGAN